MRPLLFITFPQGFRISKNIGRQTSGSGGKKTVKRYLKSEHTDKQTHKHTNIWTFRLIESIGPEGRCFENGGEAKKQTFFLRGDFRPLPNKILNVRPLLSITFPQEFRISKNIGHPTSGSWGKKTVKRYLKK